jgi:carbon monoxide dehydrogenase subunit G
MKFENRFSVRASIGDVWETLLDVERVAPCLPGAKVLERTGQDEYVVGMRVKVGPISMEYKGNVAIVEKDDVAHRAVLKGSARELRGQGAADAEAEMLLTQDGDDTIATINTDVKLSGRAASMGQGVIAEVAKKLVDTFSVNLASLLTAPVEAPAAEVTGESTPAVPAPQRYAPSEEASLPVLSMLGSIAVGRLRSPRVAVSVGIALVALLVGVRRLLRR